jgi:small-conductance mechanosensitive channel
MYRAWIDLWHRFERFVTGERFERLLVAGFIFAAAILGARLARRLVRRAIGAHTSPQSEMLARRLAGYAIYAVAVFWILGELGVKLSVLLGAAGILTVALGFASQTSASNIISGLFLLGERPFVVGDTIKVGDTTGEVIAVDLMSIKLRTFDNLYVRIPNETVIKSQVTNLTHFPIRRLDLPISVAYKEDLERVRQVLLEVADQNPLCLDEPAPLVIFLGYGESGLNLQFSLWGAARNVLELRNSIAEQVKRAFDAAGIEMPYPHRVLLAGRPFAVRVVADDEPPS